ncbi:WYL domain-containing protein [Sphingomonas corticis]|uniref:WYL domain-containing protein n=1 Tax=Sphingomonas corticis TaxID=2722791 RepID=A0ABX1CR09_9SPHN|nr:WYL domain-containing protein [Sphingomonas corticis]
MTDRMAKMSRMLALVYLLADSSEGLTLDEMARELGVNRRTAERMRDVIAVNFDLDERQDDRHKRFRITGSLRSVYTRPNAAEVAALQAEVDARTLEKAPRAAVLASLLHKVKGALDDREKRRLDPDLDALARLQRTRVPAGPMVETDPAALAQVQQAILTGQCLEFDYLGEGATEPAWRRIAVYGLIHGPVTYIVGKMPTHDRPAVPFRLDRMTNVRASNLPGCPPDDWDVDAWAAQSFGIWREDDHDVVLRVAAGAVARARAWRFHPAQVVEADGDELVVRFRSGGLREIAEHLFTWGGEVAIEAPEALRVVMRERLAAGAGAVRPGLS